MGWFGVLEEVVNLAVYLVSDEVISYYLCNRGFLIKVNNGYLRVRCCVGFICDLIIIYFINIYKCNLILYD